jgi:hypothetical protein
MAQTQRRPTTQYPQYGSLIASLRQPPPGYDQYLSANVNTIYADGIAGISLGPNVAKIDLFQIAHLEQNGLEIRTMSSRINLPVNVLIELMVNTLRTLKTMPDIRQRIAGNTQTVLALLNKVTISD